MAICRLISVMWVVSACLHTPVLARSGSFSVTVDHCQPCPFPPSPFTTCSQHLGHMQNSTSSIINNVIPVLINTFRRILRVEAHSSGMEQIDSPTDIISAFNHLVRASLELKVAEKRLGHTHHMYSNSIRDPLCSLLSMLRMRRHSSSSVTCGRSKVLYRRSITDSHVFALRETTKALRILEAVHEHASNRENRRLYCGFS